MKLDDMISVKTAMDLSGFSRAYINAEIGAGNLIAHKFGNANAIERKSFDAWMAKYGRGVMSAIKKGKPNKRKANKS